MNSQERGALLLLAKSEDPYLRVLASLAMLKLERGKQYNVGGVALKDYFPLGRVSYVQMCHVKALRLRATLDNTDSFKDSAMDLANYAIFAVMNEGI